MKRTTVIITTAATSGLLTAAALLTAGPLNPPAGPVAPTHKTLTEVEPRIPINSSNTRGDANSVYKITQPGSYYLTGNITGAAAKHAIEIAASNVTIDLMGFSILGVPGSLDGIANEGSPRSHITLRNGTISGFGGDGVDLFEGDTPNHTALIEHLRVSNNGGYGIRAWDNAHIRACTATGNTLVGIFVNANSVIEACTALENANAGIFAFENSTITGCAARLNGSYGIGASFGGTVLGCSSSNNATNGISSGQGCLIADCAAYSNTQHGITAQSATVIRGNTCDRNGFNGTGAGIHVFGSNNRIENNTCTRADFGIQANNTNAGNLIIRNTCSENSTRNWDIAAGNAVAPIVVATTNAAVIAGDDYAGSLGSTDPNANFTY